MNRAALEHRILPDLDARKLADVRGGEAQELAERMLGQGFDPSMIRNTVMPLRVICRRAVEDGLVVINSCTALRMPAVRGRRHRKR